MIVAKGIREENRWFYEARFGMFIHFGLYALLGRGEWVMYDESIPRHVYEKNMSDFNPVRFDADEWVALARDAGARYIVFTAKHHDGFCLFDSALTDYKITNTPFGRDMTGELAEACHRAGMRIILYYSQPDWHHTNYVHNRGAFKDLADPPESDRPDWPAYVRYYMGQVEELCTRYGRVDGIWFDGSHKTVEEWKGREIYALIKGFQPHAVVNDRARYGDFFTPERTLPEDLTGYLFEACESVSPFAWGYRGDTPSHTAPHLVRSMVRMASRGGNYLLNVGPAPDGRIPDVQARVMRTIGRWMAQHGRSVCRTDPVFLDAPGFRAAGKKEETESDRLSLGSMRGQWGATKAGNSLFFHSLSWPDTDKLVLPGIRSRVTGIRLMSSGEPIGFVQDGGDVTLRDLPISPPDAMPQVFEIQFDGPPEIQEAIPPAQEEPAPVPVSETDRTELRAEAARLEGLGVKGARLRVDADASGGTNYITAWFVPEQKARWRILCLNAGEYRVLVSAGCPAGKAGAVIGICAAGIRLSVPMPEMAMEPGAVPAWRFPLVQAGTVTLPSGLSEITVSPDKLKWGYQFGMVQKVVIEPLGRV